MDKPFWENTYKNDDVSTFGARPNKAVEALWQIFDKGWSIFCRVWRREKSDIPG